MTEEEILEEMRRLKQELFSDLCKIVSSNTAIEIIQWRRTILSILTKWNDKMNALF